MIDIANIYVLLPSNRSVIFVTLECLKIDVKLIVVSFNSELTYLNIDLAYALI